MQDAAVEPFGQIPYWLLGKVSAIEMLVYVAMTKATRPYRRVCEYSHQTLADLTNLCVNTVKKAIRGLIEKGFVRDTGQMTRFETKRYEVIFDRPSDFTPPVKRERKPDPTKRKQDLRVTDEEFNEHILPALKWLCRNDPDDEWNSDFERDLLASAKFMSDRVGRGWKQIYVQYVNESEWHHWENEVVAQILSLDEDTRDGLRSRYQPGCCRDANPFGDF